MDSKIFVDIIIEEVLKYLSKSYKEDIRNKEILNHRRLAVQDSLSITLSIIDQWGGGYFDDGENNDGHFELYYVSDEEGKYKYRVDEGASDLFLEKIEYLHEEENLGAGTKS